MAFAIFMHRSDSIYDDVPSERYQFPKQYLTRVQECIGDWIVYLEPSKVKETKGYFAVAKVQDVIPDPRLPKMFIAIIEPGTYLDFGDPVPFRNTNGIVERGLLNDHGKLSGRAQAAVRLLSPSDFNRIIDLGLSKDDSILPRTGDTSTQPGFEEAAAMFDPELPRNRESQLVNRTIRDRNFRKNVLRAYSDRCAITGLRLINGGGRAEVEAAHIKPVQHNGPDIVSNGIALSGTAHWMFDRGLVSLSDELTVLVSRQSNDIETIRSMINDSGKLLVPERLANKPRPEYITWHRENCFKN